MAKNSYSLGGKLEANLEEAAKALEVSPEEALSRAIELLRHASQAEGVELDLGNGKKRAVVLKKK